VLHLVKVRRGRSVAFNRLLDRVLRHLRSMPKRESERGEDLLSYIHALVYHEREDCEKRTLEDKIKAAAWTEDHRRELGRMGKTIAEALREKGHAEGHAEGCVENARSTLLRQLRKRFGAIPQTIVNTIEGTSDLEQLTAWLDRFVMAETLEEMGI